MAASSTVDEKSRGSGQYAAVDRERRVRYNRRQGLALVHGHTSWQFEAGGSVRGKGRHMEQSHKTVPYACLRFKYSKRELFSLGWSFGTVR